MTVKAKSGNPNMQDTIGTTIDSGVTAKQETIFLMLQRHLVKCVVK